MMNKENTSRNTSNDITIFGQEEIKPSLIDLENVTDVFSDHSLIEVNTQEENAGCS